MNMIRRLSTFVLATLIAWSPAIAAPQQRAAQYHSTPYWVLNRGQQANEPSVDCKFTARQCWAKGTGYVNISSLLSTTRASTGYAQMASGLLVPFAANQPRITDQGLLVEEARTNDAVQSRDMTQAAWVTVGMGTAKNATGADGNANSATTLTATGTASSCTSSCTALQTITLGSSADTYSIYLKRVTGTGTVNITINNLIGATACTVVTTAFTRCTVTATLANPVIGVQLTALNDVVIADFNQMEPGGFATSPIPTTTVAVARNSDNVLAAGALLAASILAQGSVYTKIGSVPDTTGFHGVVGFDPRRLIYFGASNTLVKSFNGTSPLTATIGGGGTLTSGPTSIATGWSVSGRSIVANNGTVATDALVMGTDTTLSIGREFSSVDYIDAYIQQLSVWNYRLPDQTLKASTVLP